jgi:error-prone DNA polymerase
MAWVRRVDVNHSALIARWRMRTGLRLGFSRLDDFDANGAMRWRERNGGLCLPRQDLGPSRGFASVRPLRKLADADALGSLGHSGVRLCGKVRKPPAQLPLFAHADAPELGETDAFLPAMPTAEKSSPITRPLRGLPSHLMRFFARGFERRGQFPSVLQT